LFFKYLFSKFIHCNTHWNEAIIKDPIKAAKHRYIHYFVTTWFSETVYTTKTRQEYKKRARTAETECECDRRAGTKTSY